MPEDPTPNEDPKQVDPPADGGSDKGDDGLDKLPDNWQKEIKRLRSESASHRQTASTAKEEAKSAKEEAAVLKKAKEAEETERKKKNGEWEKLAQEKEQALIKANERTIRAELRLAAQKAGINDPSDVNFISLEGITMDDNGDVLGAEKVIAMLKQSKPHWFKDVTPAAKPDPKPKPTSSGGEPPAAKPAPETFMNKTAADFAKMEQEMFSKIGK